MSAPRKAPHACQACRRLKRKCSKGLPSCSLCSRLRKTCQYPDPPQLDDNTNDANPSSTRQKQSPVDRGSQIRPWCSLDAGSFPTLQGPDKPFPASFFLDSDYFSPLKGNSFACEGVPSWIRQSALASLEPDPKQLCETYLSTCHRWLPIMSRKHLMRDLAIDPTDADACLHVLILCMGLCTTSFQWQKREPRLYALANSLCSAAESAGLVTLRLLQSLVLLSVYELCHAIYPAAYLTIGRAARLGTLMGMHDRQRAQQLFHDADTWTLREEQRRTWWAIFVLDRFVNIELRGMPFAVPEPSAEALLPVNDNDWDKGEIVGSEHIYANSFNGTAVIGSFAMACQASHMLGKVLRHRETKDTTEDPIHTFSQARQLHHTLIALHSSIEHADEIVGGSPDTAKDPCLLIASAICMSGRFVLYHMYGCNEPSGLAVHEPLALEIQNISLNGLKSLSTSVSSLTAQSSQACPFLASALYYAATECAWFIREDDEHAMYKGLKDIIQWMRDLELHWAVGRDYLDLLEQGGILDLIDDSRMKV